MSRASISERLFGGKPLFSVEFFPPKSDQAAEQLLRTAQRMQAFSPDFVSITYGAGGSTRNRTLKYAKQLTDDFGFEVMPHLTCVGHSKDELSEIIEQFRSAGLRQIMALRGDPPKGETSFTPHADGLKFANELVEHIKTVYPDCSIAVAGYPEKHPEAKTAEFDLENLKRKVDAGANFITTQLFFDNDVYFDFVDRCRAAGIGVPIIPGLLTVSSRDQVVRFCKMCEANLPAELDAALEAAGSDKEAVEAVGVDWIARQAADLLQGGAPGIHLYILNRSGAAISIMERLKAEGYYC